MKRATTITVVVLTMLLQGLSTAWGMPAPHRAASTAVTAVTDDATQGMPCHQHSQKQPLKAHGCNDNSCQCRALCAMGSAAAVPAQAPGLDAYIAVNFDQQQLTPVAAAAPTPNRFRPPIVRS
jgi:hypothetical protein